MQNNVTKIPLVLHGSSGISYQMRKKIASKTNVAKLNIGTELKNGCWKISKKNLYLRIKKYLIDCKLIKPTINDIKRQTIKIIQNLI